MTLLVLAGTSEARHIAAGLAAARVPAVASLAGVTRRPEKLPLDTRVGGFGGADGFRTYLAAARITAVLDATHPFAERITNRTATICAQMEIPYAQVLRPAWTPKPDDLWTPIASPAEAYAHLPKGAQVFIATGRQSLEAYGSLSGRRVFVRIVDPPTAGLPFENGEFIIARPPFPIEREVELFRSLGVTHLIAKNAGGRGGRSKLEAAKVLGLPVLLIERPPMPELQGPLSVRFDTVQDALIWAAKLRVSV